MVLSRSKHLIGSDLAYGGIKMDFVAIDFETANSSYDSEATW